jgi:hypothetical protein
LQATFRVDAGLLTFESARRWPPRAAPGHSPEQTVGLHRYRPLKIDAARRATEIRQRGRDRIGPGLKEGLDMSEHHAPLPLTSKVVAVTLGLGAGSLLLLGVFALILVAQWRAERFGLWLYWSVLLSTSTAGTVMSDFMDRALGLG